MQESGRETFGFVVTGTFVVDGCCFRVGFRV